MHQSEKNHPAGVVLELVKKVPVGAGRPYGVPRNNRFPTV